MGFKALLVLLVLLASLLLLSADVAPEDAPKDVVDEEFGKNDGNLDTNRVEEIKYHRGQGRGHSGWRRGHGGWGRRGGGWHGGSYCPYGCCDWKYGRCWRCCYYAGEHVDVHRDVEPHN